MHRQPFQPLLISLRARPWHRILTALVLLSGALFAIPTFAREWHFDVSVDGLPIGTHDIIIHEKGDARSVQSDMRYGVALFSYKQHAEETWQADCLTRIDTRTEEKGQVTTVAGRVEASALRLVERILPFVRLRAFEGHLKRALKSLESDGFFDPDTGLLESHAFWRDLDSAVGEAEENGSALSIARFAFGGITDGRTHVDAARLFSRLVRTVDFACREQDGSILAAFTGTDLRSAHVVARRIASTLKQTMLSPGRDRSTIRPSITLATFKPTDNLSTLVARVGAYPKANVAH